MKIAKSVSRLGTETAFKVLAEAKKLEKEGKEIIHLSLGQPDFKTPSHVVDATIKALKDGHHGYVLPNGIIECREAVSRKIKSLYKANINPERIVIMPGCKPTMYYAISLFGEPGVEIIYPDPGFPIYKSMINFSGAKAVPMQLKEENNDKTKLSEYLKNKKTAFKYRDFYCVDPTISKIDHKIINNIKKNYLKKISGDTSTLVVVDKQGIIKYRHVGPVTKKIYNEINLLVSELE